MREIERRQGTLRDLTMQREQLQDELNAVDSQIADLQTLGGGGGMSARGARRRPGRPAGGMRRVATRRGRGGNEQSLASALHALLRGRTMGVAEMSDAVRKAGYKTASPNFRTIVNAALLSKQGRQLFRKVARGQYTSK
jgi:hypothetical protein